jgi:hypothetical protein
MASLLPARTLTIVAAMAALMLSGSAGAAHRCTSASGEVTFSDAPCPADAVRVDPVKLPSPAPSRARAPAAPGAPDPNSIMSQVQQIEAREARERQAAAQEAFARSQNSQQAGDSTAAAPQSQNLMPYKEALKRALKDAGYHQYGRLNSLQKERVDKELAKYPHLPPEPKQPANNATMPPLLVNGVPATPVGGGNYIDNTTGHFLQGAAGGVIDTQTGQFLPVH